MENKDSAYDRLQLNLTEGAQQLGLTLTTLQIESLLKFLQLLYKWNRVYNLTAVRTIDEMVGRHILDSLSVCQWLPAQSTVSADTNVDSHKYDVIDLGTGAGLPVLPLAIVRPDLTFLSVESNGKKTRFQQQVLMALDMPHVQIKQARVEEVHDQASIVISRAFTAPEQFLHIAKKHCSVDSQVIIMLGIKERMPEQLPPGFILQDVKEIKLRQFNSTRHIAVCLYTSASVLSERI